MVAMGYPSGDTPPSDREAASACARRVPVTTSRLASATLPPVARATNSPAERNPCRAARPAPTSAVSQRRSISAATCAINTSASRRNCATCPDNASKSPAASPHTSTPSRAHTAAVAKRREPVLNVMTPVNQRPPTNRPQISETVEGLPTPDLGTTATSHRRSQPQSMGTLHRRSLRHDRHYIQWSSQ